MKREIGLLQATSINMIDMVGIGPFVMLSLVIQIVGSHLFLWAWIFGAITALVDGMIWSELGAAYPLAGGSYNFLKAAYGKKWGPLMSFLFVWQTCLQAPLVVASGAIGFSTYFKFLVPSLGEVGSKAVSGTIVILIVLLLYRNIKTIGKISVFLWTGVIITMLWIIISGLTHRQVPYSFMPVGDDSMFSWSFTLLLGQASGKTIYSYLGYYNVCHLGGEIRDPARNIPRSIFISIICIAVLYLSMNLSVVGVVSWQEAMHSDFVISTFMEKIYGHRTALVATGLILWVAFASLFAVVLGYSRVPYAAAVDGHFFPIFARLHPTKSFPYISLLFIGALGFLFSIQLKLAHAISAILAMRILVQFVAQAAGVVILRRREGTEKLPFKMWLYPLPVILSIGIWIFVWVSTGKFALYGLMLALIGVIVFFLVKDRWRKIT
ncbi:MAG: APC family permease [Chitinophagaceae bacterium]|nr:APC family permease [Chitinophagaceae bacterium]